MKLNTEFYKLPLHFDVDRLVEEVSAFDAKEWRAHPTGFQGNSAIPLISVNGEENDQFAGPMLPTASLAQCPYIQQVLAEFRCVFGRSRLMRLADESEVPEHTDIQYHWYSRVRIHIPVITKPSVRFYCNGKDVHMAPGEAWIFDNWKLHRVTNPEKSARIHIVADTSGSADFWELVENSIRPFDTSSGTRTESRFVPYRPGVKANVLTEKFNVPIVMPAAEVDALCLDLIKDVLDFPESDQDAVNRFVHAVDRFRWDWRNLWTSYGPNEEGWPHYLGLVEKLMKGIPQITAPLALASNRSEAKDVLRARIVTSAINPMLAELYAPTTQVTGKTRNPVRAMPARPEPANRKIGRNDPCSCGSGRKYKHCHGK